MGCRFIGSFLDASGPGFRELFVDEGRVLSVGLNRRATNGVAGTPCPREPLHVPGLFDAHVHLRTREEMEAGRALGVFGLRDAGTRNESALSFGERPWVTSAGAAFAPEKGYGGFLGTRVRDMEQFRAGVKRLQGRGISYVKIIGSGLVDRRTGLVGPGGFEAGFLARMIREAGATGLSVSVHANGDDAVRSAIRGGVRSVEHGFLMEKETVRMLADHEVYWIPTIHALAAGAESGPTAALDTVLQKQLENLAYASDAGVRLAVGTDAGSPGIPFGRAVLLEMKWWKKAGLSFQKILEASVCHGSELSGFEGGIRFRPGDRLSLVQVWEEAGDLFTRPLYFEGTEFGTSGRHGSASGTL